MTDTAASSTFRILLPRLARTPARFPVPLACGIGWAAVTIARDHQISGLQWDDVERLQVMFMSGFFLSLAGTLFSEGRNWNWFVRQGIAAGALALTVYVTFTAGAGDAYDSPAFYMLGPGGALLMTVAPFVRRGADSQAVWTFNLCSWVSALFGFIVAVALVLGLAALLGGLETLFGVDISGKAYTDVWIVCLSVVWPWQALAGVPGGFGSLSGGEAPRWADYLVSWLLVPLALAYLSMLVAFALMILATWSLPRGTIGWMVGIFAAFGVAVWSAVYGLRESGNVVLRFYYRYFHFAMFVPVLLLAVGVGARVAEYGITEKRYALVLLTVWLAAIGLYGVLWRPVHLIVAPASLAALLILGSLGPWGATSISLRSQLGQLEAMLAEAGVLRGGRLSKPSEPVGNELASRISSVVDYLNSSAKRKKLMELLSGGGIELADGSSSATIVTALGLEYVDPWGRANFQAWGWSRADPDVLAVGGFETAVKITLNSGGRQGRFAEIGGSRTSVIFANRGDTLEIAVDGRGSATIDLAQFVETLRRDGAPGYDNPVNGPLMTIEATGNRLKTRIYFTSIYGEGPPEAMRIEGFSFIALIGLDDSA